MNKILVIGSVIGSLIVGCSLEDVKEFDSDGDTVVDANDDCPNNPDKKSFGVCGCDEADVDTDGDKVLDCKDACPDNPDRSSGTCPCDSVMDDPGPCGCYDSDRDNDTILDCIDGCPDNPHRTEGSCPCEFDVNEPGVCGCDSPDRDADTTADCNDDCPDDPNIQKIDGICECNEPDSDGDGTIDCMDQCKDDPNKVIPGVCECGIPDDDTDNDTVPDCIDECPEDPNKTVEGLCPCGIINDFDGVVNKGCQADFKGDTSEFDNSPEGDLDGDEVMNKDDVCPYNKHIQTDEQYESVGKGSCAAFLSDGLHIYPGSFFDDKDLTSVSRIHIHGKINLNYQKKYDKDRGSVKAFDNPLPLWNNGNGKENTSIKLPKGIIIDGDEDAELHYTYEENGETKRAFLSSPLFANLDSCSITNLLIDIDFFNHQGNNKLHAGLANYVESTTLTNVGMSGYVDTNLRSDNNDHGYGCLVGILGKDSALISGYVTNCKLTTMADNAGGIVGFVKTNKDISISPSEIVSVKTSMDRGYIGGLFGFVIGSANITVNNVKVGDVEGKMDVGGLVGLYRGTGHLVVNDLNVNSVSGKKYVGGMIGLCHKKDSNGGKIYIDSAKIKTTSVSCDEVCGGVFGAMEDSEFSLSNIESDTDFIKGNRYLGGFAGDANFNLSSLCEFKQISTHVGTIEFNTSTGSVDRYTAGMLGRLRMNGDNGKDIVKFSKIVSEVDAFTSQNICAGLIANVEKSGDNAKHVSMTDVLSIIHSLKEASSTTEPSAFTSFAGLMANVFKSVPIEANNVVSAAILPNKSRTNALFVSYSNVKDFTPNNVNWCQFDDYSESTVFLSEQTPNINMITNANVNDVVNNLNASTDAKWEVKKDVMFDGKPFDIPWLSW